MSLHAALSSASRLPLWAVNITLKARVVEVSLLPLPLSLFIQRGPERSTCRPREPVGCSSLRNLRRDPADRVVADILG